MRVRAGAPLRAALLAVLMAGCGQQEGPAPELEPPLAEWSLEEGAQIAAEAHCRRGPMAECGCDFTSELALCSRACQPLVERWSHHECIERWRRLAIKYGPHP